MTSRKKTGVTFWATVVVVASLLYVASFGPACWTTSRFGSLQPVFKIAYRPLDWAAWKAPAMFADAIEWWGNVGMAERWVILIGRERGGEFLPGPQIGYLAWDR